MTQSYASPEVEAHEMTDAEREWYANLDRAAPNAPMLKRARRILWFQFKDLVLRVLQRIPGLARLAEPPETQPLRSGSFQMYRWWKKPFGTPDKPRSLAEIPWDYVHENEDRIPFFGLREYWYPALQSDQLRRGQAKAITLLGENLVLFRDADGRARCLENRCPHRGPLLSLGQVGVWKPGTLTCRYHGMTFDGDGECVAFLSDGPKSPMCGKARARAFPVEEHGGVILVYMGEREPKPFLESFPHASEVFAQKRLIVIENPVSYNHLNILDNTTDLTHVGCLHYSCALFGDQRMGGEIAYEEIDGGAGLHAFFKQRGGHAGGMRIDEITWYLPNLVFHGPGELGAGAGIGYFWFVPEDIDHFTGWLILGIEETGSEFKQEFLRRMLTFIFRRGEIPGVSCFFGGDAPMQASQGVIARWDREYLARTDRAMIKVRRMLMDAHQAEVAERHARVSATTAN